MARLKDEVTIAQEKTMPNVWNGTMFGDLEWPLNASRRFVSISWASCLFREASNTIFHIVHTRDYVYQELTDLNNPLLATNVTRTFTKSGYQYC